MLEDVYQTITLPELRIPKIDLVGLDIDSYLHEGDSYSHLKKSDSDLVIKDVQVVVEISTGFIIPSVLYYIAERTLSGLKNTSVEARALRLYFEFLAKNELQWDIGDSAFYRRPLNRFSSWLSSQYHNGDVAGTTAISYFNSVCRFYKFHLAKNHPFKKSVPVEFSSTVIKMFDNDLTSHITGREIVIDIAKCRPNINSRDKVTELIPFSVKEQNMFFDKLSKHGSIELNLICLLAITTGLRAMEIGDLRRDMISHYNGDKDFIIRLGPEYGHKTKHQSKLPIRVYGDIVQMLLNYNNSKRFINRLKKYKGERPNVFLNQSGNPFTQHSISTAYNKFLHQHIYPECENFDHKFHDLRVTFGVNTMSSALNASLSTSEALSYTKSQMRHKNINDTNKYLEYFERGQVVEKQSDINEKLLEKVSSNIGYING